MASDLVLGMGCERGISSESVIQGIRKILAERDFPISRVSELTTIDLKQDETGLRQAARQLNLPIRFYTSEVLSAVEDIPNPSSVVEECVGTPGVAEAAAMKASGNTTLLMEKKVLRPEEYALTLSIAEMTSGGVTHE